MFKNLANKKIYLSLVVVMVIIVAIIFGTAFTPKETVASVNGEPITKDELYEVLAKQYGRGTLSYLIDNKIVEIAAENKNISITDKEIGTEMKKIIEANGGEDSFSYALEQSGITEKEIETDIVNYLKIVKLLESEVEITDEEIKTHFEGK
ncbi:hypothetical protein [Niallia sp. Krafla_26]|uniref:hypothetical protein n=1 Tax=Niallia sp. Krafla_26 TaxID=3064703 RepID=UPI003D185F4E